MTRLFVLLAALFLCADISFAQQLSPIPATPVQQVLPFYSLTAISSTAAINTQTTLTIPAPPNGIYNYVCSIGFNVSHTSTGAQLANQVTTSTNFNSFALKFSVNAVALVSGYDFYQYWGSPASGCVKSAVANTATTFVSPAAAAQSAFTWYATYFTAP